MAHLPHSASDLPPGESAEFRRLLREHGLDPEGFAVQQLTLVPDFGRPVTLVAVTGVVEATYSRAAGAWLLQLERDLRGGLFEEGRRPPP